MLLVPNYHIIKEKWPFYHRVSEKEMSVHKQIWTSGYYAMHCYIKQAESL